MELFNIFKILTRKYTFNHSTKVNVIIKCLFFLNSFKTPTRKYRFCMELENTNLLRYEIAIFSKTAPACTKDELI